MVTVKDKRCDLGHNVRTKKFDTLQECEKWVRSLKNRYFDSYQVLMNENGKTVGRTYSISDKE